MARWLEIDFKRNRLFGNTEWYESQILFPMGSRTYASATGAENYDIQYDGGWSWATPWAAGFYALCVQVKPDITPKEFIEILINTSVPAEKTTSDGSIYKFGNIVNPAEVIRALQGK
jgi:hypothetical protein